MKARSFLAVLLTTLFSQFNVLAGGVTIVTHGFKDDGSNIKWVSGMVAAITERTENDTDVFKITYKLKYNWTQNLVELEDVQTSGPWLGGSTHNGETVIVVDWRDLANITPSISNKRVAEFFINNIFMDQFSGKYLAEQPIHLIGHSRGGSMVCEMARLLGYYGICVDQITTLDPRPVGGDAPLDLYENILFADNYYQKIGVDITGSVVNGAYNRELTTLSGEGYILEHSDVHLWYHGTIDTATTASNGDGQSFDATMRNDWYESYETLGETAGFYYSRICGEGDRLKTSSPNAKSGYHDDYGGSGSRTSLDWSNASWPNILKFGISRSGTALGRGRTHVTVGEALSLTYTYQDYNSSSTVRFYMDVDQNPYNGNSTEISELEQMHASTGITGNSNTITWNTSSVTDDADVYIYAEITDTLRTRYMYALPLLELVTQPEPPGSVTVPFTADEDAIVHEEYPELNSDDGWYGVIGSDSGLLEYALVKFELSSIPYGSVINSSILDLCVHPVLGHNVTIQTRLNLGSWDESSVTWNKMPDYSGFPLLWQETAIGADGEQHILFSSSEYANLNSSISAWVNDPSENNGFHVYSQSGQSLIYMSEDAETPSRKPLLTINYTPPPPPDLIVADVDPDPSPAGGIYYAGQSIDWDVTVKNIGLGSAASSKVGYYLGTHASDLSNRFDRETVSSLDFSETDDVSDSYTFKESDVGTRYVICKANYNGDIDEPSGNNTKYYGPFTVRSAPPGNVSGLSAISYDSMIRLTWTNPGDVDFDGVKIMRKTGSYPTDKNDGTEVYDGTGAELVDLGLSNDTPYYYKAFSYDTSDVYASGSTATATPFSSPVHYVSTTGTHAWPYASLATASTNIQDAVDAAQDGDTVLVGDGHYLLSSEIVVDKDITIQSLNGPDVTIVDGGGSVRCFNLSGVCTLSGFAITNGYSSSSGGGIYCHSEIPVISNCTIIGCLTEEDGGGIRSGTMYNCAVSRNLAKRHGGGMFGSTANNCSIFGNSADWWGGGMFKTTAKNCTIFDNSAGSLGGGVVCSIDFSTQFDFWPTSTVHNCIIWGNTAPINNDLAGAMASYTCSPDVDHGVDGNITNAPLLASLFHIATNSPCRGAGSAAYATGTDIDGEAWLSPPSMGCDEYHGVGSVTGPIDVAIEGNFNVASGCPLGLFASIHGAATMHVWDFGDGMSATNNFYPKHTWVMPGTYSVVLTAFNETYPAGVSATQVVQVATLSESSIHVSNATGNDTNDGLSWVTAKATIQAGVDEQLYEGGIVWVSNGTYVVSSEITVGRNIVVQSVNGADVTIVDGGGSNRCFNLAQSDSLISDFTITNGYSASNGGGVYCGPASVVSNCVFIGNLALRYGGGMHRGTVENCMFTSNSAEYGCGMAGGSANHCTFSGNYGTTIGKYSYATGGGAIYSRANNCIFTNNSAANSGGGMASSMASNCTFSANSAWYGGGMNGCKANNCTFSANSAYHGGGLYRGVANNCTITGNSATNSGGMHEGTAINCLISSNLAEGVGGGMGGVAGAGGGTAINCIISGNSAGNAGGMGGGTAINCTIMGNTAHWAGGILACKAKNCIIWDNIDGFDAYNLESSVAYRTCSPDVMHGTDGNITNAPIFVDLAGANYHLQPNSPCINWGSNAYTNGLLDLDGRNRVVGGFVDMGAYEYQGLNRADMDEDGMLDAWEKVFFNYNASPNGNADNDGSSNEEEYIAGTNPTNSASYFHVTTTTDEGSPVHFVIEWQAVSGRVYNVYWTPSLMQEFQPLEIGIQYPQNSYTDTVHTVDSSGFYRVVVMRADYDSDGDGLPNDWETQYDVEDAMAHSDSDGFNNLEEFIAGTDPTNSASFFTTASTMAEVGGTNCFVVEWISIPDRLYSVQWSTNLVAGFHSMETSIEHPQHSYTDTIHNAESEGFYKVEVRMK